MSSASVCPTGFESDARTTNRILETLGTTTMQMILKLIAGILAGILIGVFAPEVLIRALLTFKELFGQLLFFTIPLLILFYITAGIAGLPRASGHLLGRTVGTAYCSTILAGTMAFLIAALVVPVLAPAGGAAPLEEAAGLEPFLRMNIPPVIGIMSALATAFIFGLGIAATGATTLKNVFEEGRDVIEKLLVTVIIPLLPFYIAGVFAEMAAAGTVFETLQTFGIVLLLSVALHWVWIGVLYTLAGVKSGQSPFTLIKNMLPAYVTALGTMSSAATIPYCSSARAATRCVRASPVSPFHSAPPCTCPARPSPSSPARSP